MWARKRGTSSLQSRAVHQLQAIWDERLQKWIVDDSGGKGGRCGDDAFGRSLVA